MRLGFIGLGVMGRGMALNICKGGKELLVCDVDSVKLKEFKEAGVAVTSDLAEVAQTDLIFLSLPDTAVVESVLLGSKGLLSHLRKGCIVVDLSTITYNATIRIQEALEKAGVNFLDAPVSGMEARANDGTLTVMCGGTESVFERVKPYFECIGNLVLYMGKAGSGQLTKLINQVLFDINAAAIAEILPMSAKMGLDCEKVGKVVNSGTGRSYASEFFIDRILERKFSDGYLMDLAYKDLISAAELSANMVFPMPVLAAATSTYQMALRMGYGQCDKGGMLQVFEELLGVTFRKAE